MDTRYWGPSGWSLLHSIVSAYNPSIHHKSKVISFFDSLPTILPCIYCRQSLTEYYQQIPLTPTHLQSNPSLQRWLYRIHNLVNGKLRGQGLPVSPDPPITEIINKYSGRENTVCLHGWNFLYCIAMNYPDQPHLITETQRHNYRKFYDTLAELLPNHTLREKLSRYRIQYPLSKFLNNRSNLVKWLYGFERNTMAQCPCFSNRCKAVEKYRAGCKGKNDDKPTCRRIKKNKH